MGEGGAKTYVFYYGHQIFFSVEEGGTFSTFICSWHVCLSSTMRYGGLINDVNGDIAKNYNGYISVFILG